MVRRSGPDGPSRSLRTLLGAGLALGALQVGACTAGPATTAPEPTTAGTTGETADAETTAGGSATPPTTDSSTGPGTTGSADECEREPSRSGEVLTLQEVIDEAVDGHDGGIVVALDRDGGEIRVCAAGTADPTGTPLQPTDAFRVASITKTFTAVVLLQLVEEGELGLDDAVGDHLPDLGLVEGVSVRQLLHHSSGIPDVINHPDLVAVLSDFDRVWTNDEALALAGSVERDFEPGAEHVYSNTNYLLAQMVIESVSDRTLADLVEERITGPLDLADTAFAPAPDLVTGFSDVFEPDGHTEGVSYRALETLGPGAGALISTASDVAVFYRALAAGELLSRATMTEMTEFEGRGGFGLGMGLGVWRLSLPSGPGYGHGGNIPGYVSYAGVTPDAEDVIVLLSNDDDLQPRSLLRLTFAAW